jgi:fido (protein-threonine AMPylation protein)
LELIACELPEGATPIDADEAAGLLPKHIRTQGQLNQWEEENILEAEAWAFQKNWTTNSILSEAFVRKLHQAMFNKTWSWAGKFRRSDKNIGVEFTRIAVGLNDLLENIKTQYLICRRSPKHKLKLRQWTKLLQNFTINWSGYIPLPTEMVDMRG